MGGTDPSLTPGAPDASAAKPIDPVAAAAAVPPSPPADGGKLSPSPQLDELDPIAVGAEALAITLPEFEGPLDLLLHVIQKEELEIINISISFIADKYLSYIKIMKNLNLDIAGEYLLMAATLAWLKSRELVPPTDEELAADALDEEEVGDPREALIRRLLEYQKYKEAAAMLGNRPVMGRNVWGRGMPGEEVSGLAHKSGEGTESLEEVPVFSLIEALERVLAKAKVVLTHDVVVERISITDKINELVDRLSRTPTMTFEACFDKLLAQPIHPSELRHQLVITFMALLEMTRLKMIRLHQAADRSEIYISSTGNASIGSPPTDETSSSSTSSSSTSSSSTSSSSTSSSSDRSVGSTPAPHDEPEPAL